MRPLVMSGDRTSSLGEETQGHSHGLNIYSTGSYGAAETHQRGVSGHKATALLIMRRLLKASISREGLKCFLRQHQSPIYLM